MSKNKKQDLEKIFQEAAENYYADFEEKDWQAMKSMLDQERHRLGGMRKTNIYRTIMFIAAFLLLTSGVYMLSSNVKDTTQEFEKKSTIANDQISLGQQVKHPISKDDDSELIEENTLREGTKESLEDIKLKEAPSTQSSNNSDPVTATKAPIDGPGSKSSHAKQPANKIKPEDKILSNQTDDDDLSEYAESKSAPDVSQELTGKTPAIKKNTPVGNKTEGIESEHVDTSKDFQSKEAINRNNDKKQKDGEIASIDSVEEKVAIDSLAKITESEPTIEKDSPPSRTSSLSLTLMVGPDISSIGLEKVTTPGYSFGMMIHYNISKKFNIGIGALKSNKKYLGKGSDYNISADYWKYATNNVIPDEVAGQCAILEIPIELKFSFFTTQKTNLYFSGGSSSYFMLNESYQYSFDEPNPYASERWSSDKAEGKHLFNIINFSVGYERSLSEKFHIGIAPYIKVPVEEIGWSKVKFISMGTYFTLRYNLLNK